MWRVFVFLAAMVLPHALIAQDQRSLSGSVSYLERMALAHEARVIIEVLGPDLSRLAEARIPTDGQQVPIMFQIDLPDTVTGSLRAGLAIGGRVVWLGAPVTVAPDGADDLGEIMLARHTPMGFVADYRCGAVDVHVGLSDTGLVLDVAGARRLLRAVPAASGARYEAPDDPKTSFWSRSDAALVSVDGIELAQCHLALPTPETPWRGGGNEPFWSVRVDAGVMALSRLGMQDLILPLTAPQMTDAGDIVVIAADPDRALRAVLLRRPVICRDTMTGMPHPETVALSMGDHTIHGCGGDPARLLEGRTWLVEDIAGAGVIDRARVSLGFGTDGRVAGSGGCNRWFARFDLTGETLSIGPAGATMMACAPALMDQERRFLAALSVVRGFDIDATGALVLLGPDGAVMTLRGATDGSAP
jgi:heat shock protein HslJ/uncharacterized lipoprotein YbaY